MKMIKARTHKFCKKCSCGSLDLPIVHLGLHIRCENCYRDMTLMECNVAPIHYLMVSGKARYLILINGWNNANS